MIAHVSICNLRSVSKGYFYKRAAEECVKSFDNIENDGLSVKNKSSQTPTWTIIR